MGHSWVCRSGVYATQPEAPNRPRRSALHYLHVLSAKAALRQRARAESGSKDSWRGARTVWHRAAGVRNHAGACACVDQRTAGNSSREGDPGVQAARGAADAWKETAGCATVVGISGSRRSTAKILATAVLRLQCVYGEEATREIGLYSY